MTKKSERTANYENFIGVYDNFILKDECKKIIRFYEEQDKFKKTVNRQAFENANLSAKKDNQLFLYNGNLEIWHSDLKTLIANFDLALNHYEKETGVLDVLKTESFHYTTLKVQKTLPTEGYHVWHIEHSPGFDCEKRMLAFTIYLNDVKDGGETEFLHFSKRIKPKTGRIVIWPASFPYVHRGNPPLSGEKYILTSWMMLR